MSGLEFTSNLIDSLLSLPVLLVGLVLIFRKQLSELLDGLASGRGSAST
jgi:hypothetical protein